MPLNPFPEYDEGIPLEEPVPSHVMMVRAPGELSKNPQRRQLEQAMMYLNKRENRILEELKGLTDATGMPITQENGQRRYGPPPLMEDVVPPRGSEVFVGKLPRDCFEPELVPVFESVGKIFELRLMMDFSGSNRGYCFVHYFNPEDAKKAVELLHNYEIRPGKNIGVVMSVDNCRLFFGDLPKDKSAEEIRTEVDKLIGDVVDVIVRPNRRNKENNLGFAFVEFKCHRAAAMARRKFVSGKIKMWGCDVSVDWADPQDDELSKKPKKQIGEKVFVDRRCKMEITERPFNDRRRPNANRTFRRKEQVLRGPDYPVLNQLAIRNPVTYDGPPAYACPPPPGHGGHGMFQGTVRHDMRVRQNAISSQTFSEIFGETFFGVPGVPANVYMSQWTQVQPSYFSDFPKALPQPYQYRFGIINYGNGMC